MEFILMSLFSVLVLMTSSPLITCQPTRLTNVNMAALGYDAVLGNPLGNGLDVGFHTTGQVFNFTYKLNTVSSDGKWIYPDNVIILPKFACSYQITTRTVENPADYIDRLALDAAIQSGTLQFKFSGSPGYKTISDGTTDQGYVYVISTATCGSYTVKISSYSPISLTNNFIQDVLALPSLNGVEYLQFFAKYGTHYATSTDMGAKVVSIIAIDQASLSQLVNCGLDVLAAASSLFPLVNADPGASAAADQNQNGLLDAFKAKIASTVITYQGKVPTVNQPWNSWAQVSTTDMEPLDIGSAHSLDSTNDDVI